MILSMLILGGCSAEDISKAKSNIDESLENAVETHQITESGKAIIEEAVDTEIQRIEEQQKAAEEAAKEAEKHKTIKLSVAGDCLLAAHKGVVKAGNFASKALEHDWEYFLDGVDEIFEADDFTIVNLECVLSDKKLSPAKKSSTPAYWYIGPTENTNILTSQSVEICNLSNNHTGDYGTQGAQDTIDAVVNAGMLYGNNDKTCYFEKYGFKIALICNGLWYEGQETQIINRLHEAEKQSDFQIVYYHGGKERINKPEDWKIRASRRIVDAGADLVIGNHPHVIQPMEEYNGVLIVYSMGNFVFGDEAHPQNRTIILTSDININTETKEAESVDNNIIPCYIYTGERNQWQPTVIPDGADKQRVLDFMNWKVDKPL